jgi:hypothetical protein
MLSWNTKWQKESPLSSNVRLGPAPCRPQCQANFRYRFYDQSILHWLRVVSSATTFFSLAQQYLETQPILIPHVAG